MEVRPDEEPPRGDNHSSDVFCLAKDIWLQTIGLRLLYHKHPPAAKLNGNPKGILYKRITMRKIRAEAI